MHPCPGNLVTIGCVVVYSARHARAFSAGINCRHCIYIRVTPMIVDELDILDAFLTHR